MRRLGYRGFTQCDFTVFIGHLAVALKELQIPPAVICQTMAALQPMMRLCKETKNTAVVKISH